MSSIDEIKVMTEKEVLEAIKRWVLEDYGSVKHIDTLNDVQYEQILEDSLQNNPEMLMPSLTVISRQSPTATGALDLLGIDEDGRLVIFELKRGTLAREAVAQVVDYTSYLAGLDVDVLAQYLVDHSENEQLSRLYGFQNWY